MRGLWYDAKIEIFNIFPEYNILSLSSSLAILCPLLNVCRSFRCVLCLLTPLMEDDLYFDGLVFWAITLASRIVKVHFHLVILSMASDTPILYHFLFIYLATASMVIQSIYNIFVYINRFFFTLIEQNNRWTLWKPDVSILWPPKTFNETGL